MIDFEFTENVFNKTFTISINNNKVPQVYSSFADVRKELKGQGYEIPAKGKLKWFSDGFSKKIAFFTYD